MSDNIIFSPDRPAVTVLPDAIDEATGERIEGTSVVSENHLVAFAKEDQITEQDDSPLEWVEEEPTDEPEEFPEATPLDLADISEQVMESDNTYQPEVVEAIVATDLGNSPEAITVQFLATKFFEGEMTGEEAIRDAIESGLDTDKLAFYFHKLKSHFQ